MQSKRAHKGRTWPCNKGRTIFNLRKRTFKGPNICDCTYTWFLRNQKTSPKPTYIQKKTPATPTAVPTQASKQVLQRPQPTLNQSQQQIPIPLTSMAPNSQSVTPLDDNMEVVKGQFTSVRTSTKRTYISIHIQEGGAPAQPQPVKDKGY